MNNPPTALWDLLPTFCCSDRYDSNFDTVSGTRYAFHVRFARVAQWIERLPPEQEAAGSNPAAGIGMIVGRVYRGPS